MIQEPRIDFQVIETGDPKLLIVQDFSEWTTAQDRPSIIEIAIPNTEEIITKYFQKNSYNGFNTSNLNISTFGTYNSLPDGIYDITVKGSPSTLYNINKKYLKTDKTELNLATLYLRLDYSDLSDPRLKKVQHFRFLIEAAKNYMKLGEITKAAKALKRVSEEIKREVECDNCI